MKLIQTLNTSTLVQILLSQKDIPFIQQVKIYFLTVDQTTIQTNEISIFNQEKPIHKHKNEFDSLSLNLLDMYQNLTFKKKSNVINNPKPNLLFTGNKTLFNKSQRIKKKIFEMNYEYLSNLKNQGEKRLILKNNPIVKPQNNSIKFLSSTIIKPVEKILVSDLPHCTFTAKGRNYSVKNKIHTHYHPVSKKEARRIKDLEELNKYLNFNTEPSYTRTISVFKSKK